MSLLKKLEMLAKAFCAGEIDELEEILHDECKYNSDYAHKRMTSAKQIVDRMHTVYRTIEERKGSEHDATYSYEMVELDKIFKEGVDCNTLKGDSFFEVYEKGLLLYQNSENPVAVVYIKATPGEYITEINLSRNRRWFDIEFHDDGGLEDDEMDIPYTVKPVSRHDVHVKALQNEFTHQKREMENLDDSKVYIWRKADSYFKTWINDNGYILVETQIFDDCIGYRCNRKGYAYTLYMYAYGQSRTTQLDGDYCSRLLEYSLSKDSEVLVAYLHVKRFKKNDEIEYLVCNYAGDEDRDIELWKVSSVLGKPILEYYPRKEMRDMTHRLMYAFNHENRDVFDCIINKSNPAIDEYDAKGVYLNAAFYNRLHRLHKEKGDMKIGYVRKNDVIYSEVPYIENYGYFGFKVDNSTDKIIRITTYPFEGREGEVVEFIKTDQKERDEWYSNIPALCDVKPLAPEYTERFALKLTFDNGITKKYVLPIEDEDEEKEVISYSHHVFTDKIWKSVQIVRSTQEGRGVVVEFANEFFISAIECYEESEFYTEPEICSDIVFEDDDYIVEKKWEWEANAVNEDEETRLVKVLLFGSAYNYNGISTFAHLDGERVSSIDFDYIDDFNEGLAVVGKRGYGYGFVDQNMNFAVPMIYENAESFKDGKANVKKDGNWICINKSGNVITKSSFNNTSKYEDIGEYHEGMCRVSTLKLGFMDLAYHSDYSEIAGIWGYIDENGTEVVSPQYIYAEDFDGGIAIVCKGEWTKDKKWDNVYNSGRYWTEEELWGAIDKDGNEVIPCMFDEIKNFWDVNDVFMAHYGGWKTGKWGVIDKRGNWIVDPIFEDLGYEFENGLFAFYDNDKWEDDAKLGIYDINQQKVIVEPQFDDVHFLEDGWIEVEIYDETLGRKVEKIIDVKGKEKFYSNYTSIYTWRKPYEVMIRDENGDRHGLIDEMGNVILPCEYKTVWNGISYNQKRIIFEESGKQGIKDFDGNVIIAPKYQAIHGINKPLLTVRIGDKDNYKEGLINNLGEVIVPAEFNSIKWFKNDHFACCKDGHSEMYRLVYKHEK